MESLICDHLNYLIVVSVLYIKAALTGSRAITFSITRDYVREKLHENNEFST